MTFILAAALMILTLILTAACWHWYADSKRRRDMRELLRKQQGLERGFRKAQNR